MKSEIFLRCNWEKSPRDAVRFTEENVIAMKSDAERKTNLDSPVFLAHLTSNARTSVRRIGLSSLLVLGVVLSVSAASASDQIYYFHNDHLGTPQAMSDAAGRTVWTAEYEPFGKAVVNQDPDGDGQIVINNLRFPGQYYDAETGLHYNFHRDYDPATGRYLQPDPLPLRPEEMNPYVYVTNNPPNRIDPMGLYGVCPPPKRDPPSYNGCYCAKLMIFCANGRVFESSNITLDPCIPTPPAGCDSVVLHSCSGR